MSLTDLKKAKDGKKPPTTTQLFGILEKQVVLIKLKGASGRVMRATTKVCLMHGTGLPEFKVPPGFTKNHVEGNPIVLFDLTSCSQRNVQAAWQTVHLDDIDELPFWSMFLRHKCMTQEGTYCNHCHKDRDEIGRNMLCCSRCKCKWYCSQECQRVDWTRAGEGGFTMPHKIECGRWTKALVRR